MRQFPNTQFNTATLVSVTTAVELLSYGVQRGAHGYTVPLEEEIGRLREQIIDLLSTPPAQARAREVAHSATTSPWPPPEATVGKFPAEYLYLVTRQSQTALGLVARKCALTALAVDAMAATPADNSDRSERARDLRDTRACRDHEILELITLMSWRMIGFYPTIEQVEELEKTAFPV